MYTDRGSFLLAVATFAVGGVGGYAASEAGVFKPPTHAQGVMETQGGLRPAAPVPVPAAPPAVTCDDSVGTPAACPPYPSEEGEGCGLAAKRCADFKQTMKPRVAEQAVACLNALPPAQRCDANRVSLCGHSALMNACSEADAERPAATGTTDELASRCDSILHACATVGLQPTMRECRASLAGMSTVGREKMAECMSTHCGDRGLAGCEGVVDAK
jgi:hypothetical protein